MVNSNFRKAGHPGFVSAVLVGLTLTFSGCTPKEHDTVVASLGSDSITLAEYERMYIKSNGTREAGAGATQEEREKFLDLLVKYRLKLRDAYSQNLHLKPEVNQEIEHYKGSLAQSFLTEREVTAPGIRQLYKLRSEEIRASHILLELSPNATPAESAGVYRDAYEIIAKAKAGADFGTLAVTFSKDPSAKENKGDLYYFSGGDMVAPFEAGVYAMKPGEISSAPVRTQFGLHIIKVLERKPAPGEIRASHIMIRFNSMAPTPADSATAYKKIKALQDSLMAGADFAELAKKHSDDGGSSMRGGDLNWFSRRRWVRPFDDSVMTLKVGQVSNIVRTAYGYHLIKCTDRRPLKPFEEAKSDFEQLYQQRRFQDDYAVFLARLKSEVRYARNDSVALLFTTLVDSTKTTRDSAWAARATAVIGRKVLMSFLGAPVTVDSVASILTSRPDLASAPLTAAALFGAFDKVAEQLTFSTKADLLEKSNPEFAAIIKEYREGILLYQVEQDRIWGRIAPNDSLLRLHHAAHRDKYTFPDRVRFTELRFTRESAAQASRDRLIRGVSFEQIAAEDSVRMKLPSTFQLVFASGSASLSPGARKVLAEAGTQCKNDTSLSLRLTAFPDTTAGKAKALQLASKRMDAVKSILMKEADLPEHRILPTVTPRVPDAATPKADRARQAGTLSIDIIGRQPAVIGVIEQSVLAPPADERARRADSLAPGGYSSPFFWKSAYSVLRLDSREPARQKTYEEAGAEVSTSFQDYESKRLEKEWIDGLKQRSPVVEKKELLKNAFKAGSK